MLETLEFGPLKPRAWLTIAVSAVVGASVWALSPWLVGHQEPWDAEGGFYVLALAAGGSVAGLLTPRPLWAHYLGAVAGQLAYEVLFLRRGPLFVLGIAFLLSRFSRGGGGGRSSSRALWAPAVPWVSCSAGA